MNFIKVVGPSGYERFAEDMSGTIGPDRLMLEDEDVELWLQRFETRYIASGFIVQVCNDDGV